MGEFSSCVIGGRSRILPIAKRRRLSIYFRGTLGCSGIIVEKGGCKMGGIGIPYLLNLLTALQIPFDLIFTRRRNTFSSCT